jgi:hypothetical protein
VGVCAKCQGPKKVLPRVSKQYFGKTEIRLCENCKLKNKSDSVKRAAYKRKLRGSTEIKNSLTHTTVKRQAYQEGMEALLKYWEESKKA